MDAFLKQIPTKLRQGVVDGYTKATMARPVHHHNGACPLNSHLAKRNNFLQTCPFPLGTHHCKHLTDNIVKAYKCHQVCFLCGSPMMPARTRTPPTTTTTTTTTTTHKCTPLTTITSSSIFTTKDAYYTLQLNLATANSIITKEELSKQQQQSTTISNRHNPSPQHSGGGRGGGRTCGRPPVTENIPGFDCTQKNFLLLFDTRVYEAHYPGIVNNCI